MSDVIQSHLDTDSDGYPTDEHTMHSFTRPKEKEAKRLSILQLARNRLARKALDDEPDEANNRVEAASADGSSFLGNVDIADVETNPSDDASFLDLAGVEDGATLDLESAANTRESQDVEYYDVHASTLSRASVSTRASTIGDLVLKESNVAARMMVKDEVDADDNGTISTYSYRRAFDNVELGSNYTSTCSALTDEYCYGYAQRRTGMSDAIQVNEILEEESPIKQSHSGPVDADTGATYNRSAVASQDQSSGQPPAHYLSNGIGHYDEKSDQVTFGGAEGYVDEEAILKYSNSTRSSGCCSWLASSSTAVKIVVACSLLLMLVSLTGVAIALLLPDQQHLSDESFAVSSEAAIADEPMEQNAGSGDVVPRLNDAITSAPTSSQTAPPTARSTNVPSLEASVHHEACDVGASCLEEGSRCTDGTTETCCGSTYDSFVCDCANVNGKLQYMCFFTDACLAPCETFVPSTLTPSAAPEYTMRTTSPTTEAPSESVSNEPSTTKGPSEQPTASPTTAVPSSGPTESPSTSTPTFVPTSLPTQWVRTA